MDGYPKHRQLRPAKKNAQLADDIRQIAVRVARLEQFFKSLSPAPSQHLPKKRNRVRESQTAELIAEYFSEEELLDFALELGQDYEALPGSGKAAKARELVELYGRRSLLDELIQQLMAERPNVEWPLML